ncbi:type I secretion system permease/ATPase [Rhizobium sp. 18055]|uniref:type I secretion system permease/ATPase n=1 Tax=Rhizobium sp. 18055 TaxID=2681403 RepID=UPI001359E6F4|nr:type I secretion system permease/ATPase [Rhizobium sp. 18055]
MSQSKTKTSRPFLISAVSSVRGAFFGLGMTSCIVNILALTGSFFMLQVYDRVIPARSLPTLVGLSIITLTLFAFQGLLELVRSLVLARLGQSVDERFGPVVFRSFAAAPSRRAAADNGLQPLRDIDMVRGFLSGPGPTALFDLPWMPFYLGLCFVFHVWIGVVALAGALLLIGLTILAEIRTRQPTQEAARIGINRMALAEATRRNAETVASMGFAERLEERWSAINLRYRQTQYRATSITVSLSTLSRVVRLMLQSGVLAVGAVLVIRQEATGGIMIASSILVSRALAPVELAIGQWRGFAAARESWSRLVRLSETEIVSSPEVRLPAPHASLKVENLHLAAPGSTVPVVRGVSFEIKAGEAIGIVGPSASGKSSLARGLVGLWEPRVGAVRLDRASLSQWEPEALGRHIGYLPQDIGLFDGSIAENIARFDRSASSEAIVAAAHAAGIYEMIVQMPDGFDTEIGEQGAVLSAGQRQRLALARALYGEPFLVVLDEPNANLDTAGDAALTRAIEGVCARGGVAIVIAHRPSALASVNKVLVLANGQMQGFGPKEEFFQKPAAAASAAFLPVRFGRVNEGRAAR